MTTVFLLMVGHDGLGAKVAEEKSENFGDKAATTLHICRDWTA